MRMVWMSTLALTLAGCGDKADDTGAPAGPATGVWLERAGYTWTYFNHRVSHLTFELEEDAAFLAVIGGTSTTGVNPPLPEGCDADTCEEFPFNDTSIVDVGWARIETEDAVFGTARTEVLALAAGTSETLRIPLDRPADSGAAATAVLQGFSLDTDYPLSGGDACYDPALGWHVRTLSIELGEAELVDDSTVEVEVSVAFEAGASLEEVRTCVDEVYTEAVVPITVTVLGVATTATIETETVSHELAYEFKDEEDKLAKQPDPDLAERPLGLEAALVGWSGFSFAFHVDDPELRGAYLRHWSFGLDQDAGWASGHSTNYSPPSQLSGFDYAFTGHIVAVDLEGTVERGTLDPTLAAELDDDSDAVITELELE